MSQESFSLSKSFQVNKGSGCATALQFHLPCQQPPHSHPRLPRPRPCPLHPLLYPCPWRFPMLALVVEHFLQKFDVFVFFCLPSAFFWYAQTIQLFLIGCLLTRKCFPLSITSLLTDLLPGSATSISPLERLSSSGCTNSLAKSLSPCLNLSRLTKVVVVLQHCNFISLVNNLHSHPRIPPLVPFPRLLRPRPCPLHPLLCPCPWRFPMLALVVAEEFLSGFNWAVSVGLT